MEYLQGVNAFELKQQEIVGEGRFGTVFKAHSHKFRTDFALKTISKGRYTSDKVFYNEIYILRSFIHPNIVKLYGCFSTPETYNLIMQFCPNGTLKTEVKKYGCFDTAKFSLVFKQILEAIDYCHSKKIAHCDLKPENILFDEYGRVQIADWGQATMVNNEDGLIDINCGTLSYSSPGCVKNIPFNAYKNDMYSIGICMYFSVFGQDPWSEKVPIFKKQQIIYNDYRCLPKTVDKEISDVIYELISIDESKRPSAKELLRLSLFQNYCPISQYYGPKANKKRHLDYFLLDSIKKIPSFRNQNKIDL